MDAVGHSNKKDAHGYFSCLLCISANYLQFSSNPKTPAICPIVLQLEAWKYLTVITHMIGLKIIHGQQNLEISIEGQKSLEKISLCPKHSELGVCKINFWVFIRQIYIMEMNDHTGA